MIKSFIAGSDNIIILQYRNSKALSMKRVETIMLQRII